MLEIDAQPVLRCEHCNKPFDKQSTLKRHGYYCRSRKVGTITRSRSCASCARGKVRCDNKRPKCSRCITKAIDCHYPANSPKHAELALQYSDIASNERLKKSPSQVVDTPNVEFRKGEANHGDVTLDDTFIASSPGFSLSAAEFLDWDDRDIDFSDFLHSQTAMDTIQYPLSSTFSLFQGSTPSTTQVSYTPSAVPSFNDSIPMRPSNLVRSLTLRPRSRPGSDKIANLILHTLKSYSRMILRHNTPPPFLHPHLLSTETEDSYIEPLTNCISLVHMISGGFRGSRKLFWKNVHLECERLHADNSKFNKWELLAAMYAVSIYTFIRLNEGETDHNNIDFLLLATVTAVSKRLNGLDVKYEAQSSLISTNLKRSWQHWVLQESIARICVVYRVINMLVYFEPASMCDLPSEIMIAPLPAKKQLWEARDEFAWKAESDRRPGMQTSFALAANGDLLKTNVDRSQSPDFRDAVNSTSNWEEWCSGMDGLGGLIMLAATLL